MPSMPAEYFGKKLKAIPVKLTEKQHQRIQMACELAGVPMAAKARELLLEWAGGQERAQEQGK